MKDATKDNINAIQVDLVRAGRQAGRCELGRRVYEGLGEGSLDWPPIARKALKVPNLHVTVRYMLIEMAARLVQGKVVSNLTLDLRNRMDRHHPGWRESRHLAHVEHEN